MPDEFPKENIEQVISTYGCYDPIIGDFSSRYSKYAKEQFIKHEVFGPVLLACIPYIREVLPSLINSKKSKNEKKSVITKYSLSVALEQLAQEANDIWGGLFNENIEPQQPIEKVGFKAQSKANGIKKNRTPATVQIKGRRKAYNWF